MRAVVLGEVADESGFVHEYAARGLSSDYDLRASLCHECRITLHGGGDGLSDESRLRCCFWCGTIDVAVGADVTAHVTFVVGKHSADEFHFLGGVGSR